MNVCVGDGVAGNVIHWERHRRSESEAMYRDGEELQRVMLALSCP